jgi:hypothetical protein
MEPELPCEVTVKGLEVGIHCALEVARSAGPTVPVLASSWKGGVLRPMQCRFEGGREQLDMRGQWIEGRCGRL